MVVDTVSLPSRGPVARENGRLVRANSDSCLQGGSAYLPALGAWLFLLPSTHV